MFESTCPAFDIEKVSDKLWKMKVLRRNSADCRQRNLANEMNKLFSLYRLYVGDNRQPMAGGAQNLALKVERGEMTDDISFNNKPFKRNSEATDLLFDDLPVGFFVAMLKFCAVSDFIRY